MCNVRLSPCGVNGDQKAAMCNTGELGESMVSVKVVLDYNNVFLHLRFCWPIL